MALRTLLVSQLNFKRNPCHVSFVLLFNKLGAENGREAVGLNIPLFVGESFQFASLL